MATRVCRAHHRALAERPDGRLFCDHGVAGHVVTTWDVIDHKGRAYGTATDAPGKVITGITDTPPSKGAAPVQQSKPPRQARDKKCLRSVKHTNAKGAILWLRLERAKAVPFVVRWQLIEGDSATSGVASLCETAEAAEKALGAQCRIAQERGWSEAGAGGRGLTVREIPWAGPQVAAAPAETPAPRARRPRADA